MAAMFCPFFLLLSQVYHIKQVTTTISDYHHLGHLEPFGNHREPDVDTAETINIPDPGYFFREYVQRRRPLVLRGAVKLSNAYKLWTHDYLLTHYGNYTVRMESKAESDTYVPVGVRGLGFDSIANFLQHYQHTNSYVISQIPQSMEKDVLIPKCLSCPPLSTSIQEVHLFLSSKGGKTVLHRDPYSNMHCIFNGTKNWILVDPVQTSMVYMSSESDLEWGGYSLIDVDQVDLEKFPLIKDIRFSKVVLYRGDCIFMPGGYWHQVRSWGEMNTAVSIWMSKYESYWKSNCDMSANLDTLNEYPVIWRYPGQGDLTQGHMDIFILQLALLEWANPTGVINVRSFANHFFKLTPENTQREAMVNNLEERKKSFMFYLDPSQGHITTAERIRRMNVEELKILVEIIHPNDISNTAQLEYSYISLDKLQEALIACMKEDGLFDADAFKALYTEQFGGTLEKASELVSNVKSLGMSPVSKEALGSQFPQILSKYLNVITHDPATERELYLFLTLAKKVSRHDEL